MSRASLLAAGVLALAALPGGARADAPAPTDDAARAALAGQLADEAQTIERTRALVTEKLTAAETVRARRLRAAYRVLRNAAPAEATPAELMAVARRRAAARLLVDRDAAERGLLVDEAARLAQAASRTTADAQRVATIALPHDLAPPAKGELARAFGTLDHERSQTTLARRGIDLEVALAAEVTAPADGTVRYAGPIRGLDEGVVIDHGSYFTVVAKLGELAVPVGAPVHRGDRLGRAARQRVYLEVRVRIGPGGLPIDPVPVFASAPRDPG